MRMAPMSFSLNSIAASPKNPTAASSKNKNSAVISRRPFISLSSVPMRAAGGKEPESAVGNDAPERNSADDAHDALEFIPFGSNTPQLAA